ncbi:hypothetical protein AVEN_274077-1 [Araneus ventricosus]|uniref:Gustatory receptor n=1 Tax=Araneus ventricosus TaxID=182803 RepID=A0A4Y2KFW5_ARAVE|nr:hypothetical protein AVEN_274077-1 [Araneus ventricosus]
MPICFALVAALIANDLKSQSDFWTFGFKLETQRYNTVVHFIGEYICFATFLEFPCIAILSICNLTHLCNSYILQFNNYLANTDFRELSVKCIGVQNEYNIIEENVRLLKGILSTPLLFISLWSLFNLYVVLTYSLHLEVPPEVIVELVVNAFTGVGVISFLIICSSKIPENMLKIKETASLLIDKYQLNIMNKSKAICVLDRIEKKNVIYLSACGMIDFKKSLLLTDFGSLFTYGLLILKLN